MLEINSVSVRYGIKLALQDVTLELHAGEILGVIGPNGAGKSTLIRAISGVVPLSSGSIRYESRNLPELTPSQRARILAVVPQARNLPPAFSVQETVLLGRTPHLNWLSQPSLTDYAWVHHALEQTQLLDLTDRRVSELSGGEQQRVLLARALAQQTPVLLLDEPTTHLDIHHQVSLLNLIRSLAKTKDRAVISGIPQTSPLAVMLVLHDLNLAALFSDRLVLLEGGRLLSVGTPAGVLTSPLLSKAFGVRIEIIEHPTYGTPMVLPQAR